MNDDQELLRRYLEQKSEPAFAALVQRYIGLVYSVALRRVGGDAHLAEDVAQQVFVDLARKAASLVSRPSLSGWLFASAHLASAAAVRGEQRRKKRETEAHLMQTTLSPEESGAEDAPLRAVIDDLIARLRVEEREAIALRFFEKRSFAEVAAALRVTEEAARKRVDRALEKLRALLARRGVTSTSAALGVALAGVATGTAPAPLTAKVAAQAIAQGSVPAAGSIVATWAGALLPAAAVWLAGGLLIGTQRRSQDDLRRELGHQAAESRATVVLRMENDQLARDLAATAIPRPQPVDSVSAVRAAVADLPTPPRSVSAQVTVSPQGTITWNGEGVKLRDFMARLSALPATADPEARIVVQGMGTSFPALAYVIDEIRKAQPNHVTVESNAAPDGKFGFSWF